jgi:hypothetical protein
MNKQCVVSVEVGRKYGAIGLRYEEIDSFDCMEYAIMYWDRFQNGVERRAAISKLLLSYAPGGSRALIAISE